MSQLPIQLHDNTYPQVSKAKKKLFKVCVVGAGGVGKTTLLVRMTKGVFLEQMTTIGVNFEKFVSTKDWDGNSVEVSLQIWDLGGQSRFMKTIPESYVRKSHAVVFTFDLSNMETLDMLEGWIDLVTRDDLCGKDVLRTSFLMGTKLDLVGEIDEMQAADINDFMDAHRIAGGFWQTSSVTGKGISELFDRITEWTLWYAANL